MNRLKPTMKTYLIILMMMIPCTKILREITKRTENRLKTQTYPRSRRLIKFREPQAQLTRLKRSNLC
jgi:hypothetical protein